MKLIPLAAALVLLLTACTPKNSGETPPDKYNMPESFAYSDTPDSTSEPDTTDSTSRPTAETDLPDTPADENTPPPRDYTITADARDIYKAVIPLSKAYTDAALYAGVMYFASPTGITALNLADGTETAFAEGNYTCVDADPSGIYAMSADSFIRFSTDGSVNLTYPTSCGNPVCGTVMDGNYLFAASLSQTEHGIFSLSLADGTVEDVSDCFFGEKSASTRLFVTDLQAYDGMVWAVSVNQNDEDILIKADLNGKTSTVETEADGINKIDVVGDWIYYLKSRVTRSYVDIYRTSLTDGAESVVSRVVTSLDGAEESGVYQPSFRFDRIYFTGSDYILWSAKGKTVFVVDADGGKYVTVLAPDNVDGYYTESVGNYVLSTAVNERILTLLMERYGCDIRLITYPADVYESKLPTKLMAKDDDFDVYLLYNTNTSLIRSVVENGAFYPADKLEGGAVMENITKMSPYISSALTTEKGIIGVPVMYSGETVLKAAPKETWEKYGLTYPDGEDFSVEDYLDLCEKLTSLDRDLLVRTADITNYLLADFTEQYVREGEVDRDLLERLLDVYIKSYTTGGAYFYSELDGAENYTNGKLTQLLEVSEYEGVDGADYLPFPYVEDDTAYVTVTAFACVNPASGKLKEAAEYLACLSDEAYSRTFPKNELLLYPNLAWYSGFSHSEADEARFDEVEEILSSRTAKLRLTDTRLIFSHPRWVKLWNDMGCGRVGSAEAAEEFLSMIRYMYME